MILATDVAWATWLACAHPRCVSCPPPARQAFPPFVPAACPPPAFYVFDDGGCCGYGRGNDCTEISLEINISEEVTSCTVSWTFWAIDSRGSEVDRVLIDGIEVWSAPANCGIGQG